MSRKAKLLTDSPARWKRILSVYGLTKKDYNKILEEQGGACYVCQRTPQQIRRKQHLAVDHCHDTGKIRGLLCYSCNRRLLPLVKENPKIARRLVKYLTRPTTYGTVP